MQLLIERLYTYRINLDSVTKCLSGIIEYDTPKVNESVPAPKVAI